MEQIKQVRLGDVVKHRKKFITIDDTLEYKRCRVQLYAQGIVLRDTVKGTAIRTKQQQVCQLNDFVVAEMDAKFGGYGIIKTNLEGAIVSSHYFLFEIDTDHLLPEYLEFLSKTDVLQSQIKATGSTNYAAIRPYHVLEIEIPLPDLDTQKSIVSRLRELQALHAQANATLTRLQTDVKRLRQSILQQAIQGKLVDNTLPPGEKTGAELLADIRAEKERRAREQGKKPDKPLPPVTEEEMPFELPEGWVWCRLGELTLFSEAGKSMLCKERSVENGEWGIIKMSAISSGIFLENENKFYRTAAPQDLTSKIEIGDFLITRASGSADLVAKSLVVKAMTKNLLLNDKTIRYKISNLVNHDFVNFWNNSAGAREYYAKATGAKSTTMKNVTRPQINNLPTPLPPRVIQDQILQAMEGRLSYCLKSVEKLDKLEAAFTRLWQSEMQQIFKFENAS